MTADTNDWLPCSEWFQDTPCLLELALVGWHGITLSWPKATYSHAVFEKNIGSSIALWAILGVVFWRFSHCIIPVSIEYNCMFRFRHDSMQPCQVFWIISQIFHFRFQLGLRALTVSCYSFFIFIAFMVPPHCYPRVNKGNIPCVQKKKENEGEPAQ